jgi:hypothetical protein
LLALPDSVLDPQPDYDPEIHDPDDFPPPQGLVMTNRDYYR